MATKRQIKPGETGEKEMPFSEVMMYMSLAGTRQKFRLQEHNGYPSVQLLRNDNSPLGGAVTISEAGIRQKATIMIGIGAPVVKFTYYYNE